MFVSVYQLRYLLLVSDRQYLKTYEHWYIYTDKLSQTNKLRNLDWFLKNTEIDQSFYQDTINPFTPGWTITRFCAFSEIPEIYIPEVWGSLAVIMCMSDRLEELRSYSGSGLGPPSLEPVALEIRLKRYTEDDFRYMASLSVSHLSLDSEDLVSMQNNDGADWKSKNQADLSLFLPEFLFILKIRGGDFQFDKSWFCLNCRSAFWFKALNKYSSVIDFFVDRNMFLVFLLIFYSVELVLSPFLTNGLVLSYWQF